MSQNLLIKNLHVQIDGKQILKGVNLEVKPGEIHAIMGPNGSGKSTMAYTLAGHPSYELSNKKKSQVLLDEKNILEMSPDERAQAGLFLAFQYPVEVPGVKVLNFLWAAYKQRFPERFEENSMGYGVWSSKGAKKHKIKTIVHFRDYLRELAGELNVSDDLLMRGLNEGFSGGEKKCLEILQMAVLEPKFAVLDETDSGLDIDAIKTVAAGVKKIVKKHKTGVLVITHYQRILDYLKPDFAHIMVSGKIVESGGPELISKVEKEGYGKYNRISV